MNEATPQGWEAAYAEQTRRARRRELYRAATYILAFLIAAPIAVSVVNDHDAATIGRVCLAFGIMIGLSRLAQRWFPTR